MKILFLSVGALKKPYYKDGFAVYLSRIKRYVGAEEIAVKDGASSKKTPSVDVKRTEATAILSKLKKSDYVIALDERGKSYSSKKFASFIDGQLSGGKSRIVFIVGGAFGLGEDVLERADALISLSAMTMPHEMARLVAAEQVYRAFTIIKGEPYSH